MGVIILCKRSEAKKSAECERPKSPVPYDLTCLCLKQVTVGVSQQQVDPKKALAQSLSVVSSFLSRLRLFRNQQIGLLLR